MIWMQLYSGKNVLIFQKWNYVKCIKGKRDTSILIIMLDIKNIYIHIVSYVDDMI